MTRALNMESDADTISVIDYLLQYVEADPQANLDLTASEVLLDLIGSLPRQATDSRTRLTASALSDRYDRAVAKLNA